ncbi:phosphotransferase family protein [Prescottella agglutinans]|uniref:Aminoglycoside phosphotransferase (APT) family kinase protein n=1 Tax=Prescottella agglutinans TaxID=1644129 RepID=A0ABT6M8E4_9NOCA|nr:phosphotransferase family protein [Prescottella agglutinans]MDH6280169.1 aminoglycoside phosphotransferase (APT) family kinase protein [Prescottella agglutinans]
MTTESVMPEGVEQKITTTETDLEDLRGRLETRLGGRLGVDATPRVYNLSRPGHSGMSSVSVLFDLDWTTQGGRNTAHLVTRLAPEATAFPVFPGYDLQHQFDVMTAVREHSDVPVPHVRWVETSAEPLGSPFLVMERVSGAVPVDNPPYVFGGWLHELDADSREAVQEASVRVLARVHAIEDPAAKAPSLAAAPGESSLRRHFENERAYYEWTRRNDGLRIPLLERAFDWLEAHWPSEPSPDVLCWGDSRIGNIMYDGTSPAAVLDWESAVLAPRELDLGWFLFFHRMFQDMAEQFSMPGLPEMFRRSDVVAQYESAAGVEVGDLDFYLVYAALRHGIVMSQIWRRQIHFGEADVPENPDEYVLHHRMLAQLIDETYEWEK